MNFSNELPILSVGQLEPRSTAPTLDPMLDGLAVSKAADSSTALGEFHDLVGAGEAKARADLRQGAIREELTLPSSGALLVSEINAGHPAMIPGAPADDPLGFFDPDRLRNDLETNLPKALRAMADAIDRDEIFGNTCGFVPWGFQNDSADTRAHFIVKLHLAAEVRKHLKERKNG